jgi:PKD repeat protein
VGSWKGGQVVTHSYALPGDYAVVLTATNCATATAQASAVLTVLPAPFCEPVHDLEFTWTPLTPTVGQEVNFTGTVTGTLPITYTWDFGDGTRSSPLPLREGGWGGRSVSHTYALPGHYTATLTATNCFPGQAGAATATVQHTLQVLAPPVEYYAVYLPLVVRE